MILHLGVIDLPYNQPPTGKRRRRKVAAGTQTTGDVAGWLENRYHVMEIFFEEHVEDVATDLEDGLAGALESLMIGAPASLDAFGTATSKIDDRFKKFLSDREMEGLGYPGVPTEAARKGVNRRLKVKRGSPRPSFVDTGLYMASFKSWVD
jgi:hypothetical protein